MIVEKAAAGRDCRLPGWPVKQGLAGEVMTPKNVPPRVLDRGDASAQSLFGPRLYPQIPGHRLLRLNPIQKTRSCNDCIALRRLNLPDGVLGLTT